MSSNIREMRAEVKSFEEDLLRVKSKAENLKAEMSSYLLLLQKLGLPTKAEKMVHNLAVMEKSADLLIDRLQTLDSLNMDTLMQGFTFGFAGLFAGASLLGDVGIVMNSTIRELGMK